MQPETTPAYEPEELTRADVDRMQGPVLLNFETPRTGSRHRLQFTCGASQSTFALLSETEERR